MKRIAILISMLLLLSGCGGYITEVVNDYEAISSGTSAEIEDKQNEVEIEPSSDPASNADLTLEQTDNETRAETQNNPDEYDYVLIFPSDSYPETALHIYSAIANGHSDVCTIDRDGADENRKQSLKGIDTREGYDRDEWPMAMCEEGGYGASVAYIDPSDNRGAGSWVGHQLSAYEDGERILFIVEKPKLLFGNKSGEEPLNVDEDIQPVYKNCTEAREAGVTPLYEGEPGYSKKLDRDGDGIACET